MRTAFYWLWPAFLLIFGLVGYSLSENLSKEYFFFFTLIPVALIYAGKMAKAIFAWQEMR